VATLLRGNLFAKFINGVLPPPVRPALSAHRPDFIATLTIRLLSLYQLRSKAGLGSNFRAWRKLTVLCPCRADGHLVARTIDCRSLPSYGRVFKTQAGSVQLPEQRDWSRAGLIFAHPPTSATKHPPQPSGQHEKKAHQRDRHRTPNQHLHPGRCPNTASQSQTL